MKKGAPPCGLYLRIGPDGEMQDAIAGLRQAMLVISRSDYERNMHVLEVAAPMSGDAETRDRCAALIELAKLGGLTAIVGEDASAAKALNADGVRLSLESDIAAARTLLGDAAIIGLSCGADYALAERAAGIGADYIAFGGPALPSPTLFSRWATAFQQPALASGPVDNDAASFYVQAGASFLDCSNYVWRHPKGAMQAVVNMLYAIELALEKTRPN